jgi:WD repeat-containing protein 35
LIPESKTATLLDLAERFENVGICESAVICYEKAGEIKKAIDCCVLLN